MQKLTCQSWRVPYLEEQIHEQFRTHIYGWVSGSEEVELKQRHGRIPMSMSRSSGSTRTITYWQSPAQETMSSIMPSLRIAHESMQSVRRTA